MYWLQNDYFYILPCSLMICHWWKSTWFAHFSHKHLITCTTWGAMLLRTQATPNRLCPWFACSVGISGGVGVEWALEFTGVVINETNREGERGCRQPPPFAHPLFQVRFVPILLIMFSTLPKVPLLSKSKVATAQENTKGTFDFLKRSLVLARVIKISLLLFGYRTIFIYAWHMNKIDTGIIDIFSFMSHWPNVSSRW